MQGNPVGDFALYGLALQRAPLAKPNAVKPSPMAPSSRKKLRTPNTLASDKPAGKKPGATVGTGQHAGCN